MSTVTNLQINHDRAYNETHFRSFFGVCYSEGDIVKNSSYDNLYKCICLCKDECMNNKITNFFFKLVYNLNRQLCHFMIISKPISLLFSFLAT